MAQESLFGKVLEMGIEETLRKERKFFIDEIQNKIETLVEREIDGKDIAKNLLEYLNSIKANLIQRFNPFERY